MTDLVYNVVVAPSGQFLDYSVNQPAHPGSDPSYYRDDDWNKGGQIPRNIICNPMPVQDVSHITVDEAKKEAVSLIGRGMNAARLITAADLRAYAEALVRIGLAVERDDPDFIVFPLRGGLKPGVQLRVMQALKRDVLWIPFTGGANGILDSTVAGILSARLDKAPPGQCLRIAIVDTAISGHGSKKLAELMHPALVARSGPASVRFHLLYAPTPNHAFPRVSDAIERLSSRSVVFGRKAWQVPSLLVEDWDAAVGLEVVIDGNRIVVKQGYSDDRLWLQSEDGVLRCMESPDMSAYLDVLIGDAVSRVIQGRQDLRFLRDVWEETRNH